MAFSITGAHCECLSDGCQYAKRVQYRDAEIERLQTNLNGRDDFIGERGLWDEFVAWLKVRDDQQQPPVEK